MPVLYAVFLTQFVKIRDYFRRKRSRGMDVVPSLYTIFEATFQAVVTHDMKGINPHETPVSVHL